MLDPFMKVYEYQRGPRIGTVDWKFHFPPHSKNCGGGGGGGGGGGHSGETSSRWPAV